jgi:hypothetical protein
MSQEQEDAANWRMFQVFKKLSTRQAMLSYQVQRWGEAMQNLGSRINSYPKSIENADLAGMPELKDLEAAKNEMRSLSEQLAILKKDLQKVGMDFS